MRAKETPQWGVGPGDAISGGALEEVSTNPADLSRGFAGRLAGTGGGAPEEDGINRVIAYVDGFNLYFGMKSRRWHRYYWLDLPRMAQNLLRSGQNLVETKYFTSRISATRADPQKGASTGGLP